VPDLISEMLATEAAIDKLGARGISISEAEQMIWNRYVVVRNRRGSAVRPQRNIRRLLIGHSDSGRFLTLVIEETVEPTTWLLITGWESTLAERMILTKA
jgi:uncharacterized DUF497 family protein